MWRLQPRPGMGASWIRGAVFLPKSFVVRLFAASGSADKRSMSPRAWPLVTVCPRRGAIRVLRFQPRPGRGRFANRPYRVQDDVKKFAKGRRSPVSSSFDFGFRVHVHILNLNGLREGIEKHFFSLDAKIVIVGVFLIAPTGLIHTPRDELDALLDHLSLRKLPDI